MKRRVALAYGCVEPDRCTRHLRTEYEPCDDCLEQARAAIAAMREPTKAMEAAYDRRVDAAHLGEALTSEDAWHAMVDAALEDQ